MSDELKAAVERARKVGIRLSTSGVGERSGSLIQLGARFRVGSKTRAVYQCDCGEITCAQVSNVQGGRTSSCGCVGKRNRSTASGHSDSLTYNSWKAMIARCCSPAHPKYRRYGGRGIVVCDRWMDFLAFLEDMGERPSKEHSIDRYPNNDGGYEPGNCRWATRQQQARNSSTVTLLTIRGVSKSIVEWSEEEGSVNYVCILGRLSRGWKPERAVFLPKQRTPRNR